MKRHLASDKQRLERLTKDARLDTPRSVRAARSSLETA